MEKFKLYSIDYLVEPNVTKLITHKNEEMIITTIIDSTTVYAYSTLDPDKLTLKISANEIKKLLAEKAPFDSKPKGDFINNIREKFATKRFEKTNSNNESDFLELYETKTLSVIKDDIIYCTMSGNYDLNVSYAIDTTIDKLGDVEALNINLSKKHITVKLAAAHYIINNEIDYIAFALCCRKLQYKFPDSKVAIAIPETANVSIIQKIIEKEFNHSNVTIILYEPTSTN
jgi:hypothetical protein